MDTSFMITNRSSWLTNLIFDSKVDKVSEKVSLHSVDLMDGV